MWGCRQSTSAVMTSSKQGDLRIVLPMSKMGYTELGSIDRLRRAVGTHVSLRWDGSGGGVRVRIAIVLVMSVVYLRV